MKNKFVTFLCCFGAANLFYYSYAASQAFLGMDNEFRGLDFIFLMIISYYYVKIKENEEG